MRTNMAPSPVSTTDRRRRRTRWIPLSLRMFVAILLLAATGSALIVAIPAYRQFSAIRQIEKLGGSVQTHRRAPEWTRACVGDAPARAFETVFCVELVEAAVSDEDLANISRFPDLERLYLTATTVSDGDLKHLGRMQNLKWLKLYKTRISNTGLAELKGLKSLQWLDLGGTQITDEGLAELADMQALNILDLSRTSLTGSGLAYLQSLRNLETVNLMETPIVDENVRYIAELPHLQSVYLGKTALSLEGFSELRRARPELEFLYSDGGCCGLHPSHDDAIE